MINTIKERLKQAPVLGLLLMRVRQKWFRDSPVYWEKRYGGGGTSGSGSYGRLAEFKAEFLNRFVAENHVTSVIDFGCGDGSQLMLAKYPAYTGVDISTKALDICKSRFKSDSTKRFLQYSELDPNMKVDLALSLDVVYHLVEDSIFEAYIRRLFASAERFVVVYSSNDEQETVSMHVRHRRFTDWIEKHEPGWQPHRFVKNPYSFDPADPDHTSLADFYVFARKEKVGA